MFCVPFLLDPFKDAVFELMNMRQQSICLVHQTQPTTCVLLRMCSSHGHAGSIIHNGCMKSAFAVVLAAFWCFCFAFSSLSCAGKLVLNALLCLCSDYLVFSLSVPDSPIVALPPCLPLI